MFPSPLGEMGLSIVSAFVGVARNVKVSVPSRGNGVIDYAKHTINYMTEASPFPSPLGEMGLSIPRCYLHVQF